MTKTYTHAVVLTAFHGGGIVSRHTSEELALRRARRERVSGCCCGCAVVVPVSELGGLRASYDAASPYEAAR